MAVTATPKKVSISMKLNNGVDDKGNLKTVAMNLASGTNPLNVATYDNTKAMAIVDSLRPCLDKAVYQVEKTAVDILTNE